MDHDGSGPLEVAQQRSPVLLLPGVQHVQRSLPKQQRSSVPILAFHGFGAFLVGNTRFKI